MKRFALIVTDAGPLITLAVAQALDTLLLPKLPVVVPDMVRFEVIRDLAKPGAQEVADWIRLHEADAVRVASTVVFEEYQILARARPATKTSNRGEQAAAEVLDKELSDRTDGAILLFEDSAVRKQNFLIRLPDEVMVISTSEFLYGLEAAKLLPSAAALLERATTLRGNAILQRHLGGTSSESPELWPDHLSPGAHEQRAKYA
jgi:hypothetical protein